MFVQVTAKNVGVFLRHSVDMSNTYREIKDVVKTKAI